MLGESPATLVLREDTPAAVGLTRLLVSFLKASSTFLSLSSWCRVVSISDLLAVVLHPGGVESDVCVHEILSE